MLHFSRWKIIATSCHVSRRRAVHVAQLLLQGDGAELAELGAAPAAQSRPRSAAAARICCCPWRPRTCARTGSRPLRDDARNRLRNAKIVTSGLGIANNAVQVRLAKPEDADAALKELRGMVQPIGSALLGTSANDIDVQKGEGGVITITPTEPGLQQRISNAVSAAIETVRRRVDAHGHGRGQHRPAGHQPHPRAGAGPAGYRRSSRSCWARRRG